MRILRRSIVLSLCFLALFGLAYPLAETGLAQALFSHQANGSLGPDGSASIGQVWHGTKWFHGRPGAYNGEESGPSNLGPRSRKLEEEVAKRRAKWLARGVQPTAELVTGSGSGLDPDISPASAYAQVPMVAKARHLSSVALDQLVKHQVHGRLLGFLGAPYVNVLSLNEALARLVERGGARSAAS